MESECTRCYNLKENESSFSGTFRLTAIETPTFRSKLDNMIELKSKLCVDFGARAKTADRILLICTEHKIELDRDTLMIIRGGFIVKKTFMHLIHLGYTIGLSRGSD